MQFIVQMTNYIQPWREILPFSGYPAGAHWYVATGNPLQAAHAYPSQAISDSYQGSAAFAAQLIWPTTADDETILSGDI
jgi:hypothetical protein